MHLYDEIFSLVSQTHARTKFSVARIFLIFTFELNKFQFYHKFATMTIFFLFVNFLFLIFFFAAAAVGRRNV